MAKRVFNFGPGPAMIPTAVMERVRDEFLDYQGIGASVIEISHRSKDFETILNTCDQLFRELLNIPANYQILYVHGGAQMQFSAVPMNLMGLRPANKALYVDSGRFAKLAGEEAKRFGQVEVIASSAKTNYDHIPSITPAMVDPKASYLHITSNNTIFGTRWNTFPQTGDVPLVADSTSEILSRVIDVNKFGLIYAGTQKNLGPSGLAVVIARDDLLGHAPANCPNLLNYATYKKDHSLTNTPNTFAIYMIQLVLEWLKGQGGLAAMEKVNNQKAAMLYDLVDSSGGFFKPYAQKADRSTMNVCFNLPSEELLEEFLKGSKAHNLYALKGHRDLGGVRASIYNAMPLEGVKALADYMKEFQKKKG
ncbi:MAG: 3-phosphoserine/phosphohydroxythreonine transaminase [Deltaproteobacteria bacterium]|nr:3-phosphoserine/phosphohydroxythreonine transaminase [Deltaproteobacteria bacterium]